MHLKQKAGRHLLDRNSVIHEAEQQSREKLITDLLYLVVGDLAASESRHRTP